MTNDRPLPTEPEPVERTDLEASTAAYLTGRNSPEWIPFTTGLEDLDAAIGGGICRGEMVVIGARPSNGKTALVLQLLDGISRREPCILFSEEMSRFMLGKRVSHQIFGTPIPQGLKFDPGRMPPAWYERWTERKSVFVFEAQREVRRLRKTAAEYVLRGTPKRAPRIIAVDYLQLLKGQGKTRYEQITDVSMELRAMTNTLRTGTLVCAQLSRDVAKPGKGGSAGGVRMPVLSDLRDSGQIEQDADIVLLLQWPWKEDPTKPKHEFRIKVAKNRNRAIVSPEVNIAFDAARQEFMSLRDWAYRNPVDDHQGSR